MSKTSAVRLLLVSIFLGALSANANIISYYTTVYDTNFATADLGLRGVGAGTLAVSGVSGTVTQSLLFWHGPTNSTDPNGNANVNFNGTSITGTNIGFSQDNFWNDLNSQAYRANMTSLVTGNGNYALSNFQKPDAQSSMTGTTPTLPASTMGLDGTSRSPASITKAATPS